MGHNLHIPDSTQSRDHEEDHINFPMTDVLTVDTNVMVRPHIVLFQQTILRNLDVFLHILLIPFMLHRIFTIHQLQ